LKVFFFQDTHERKPTRVTGKPLEKATEALHAIQVEEDNLKQHRQRLEREIPLLTKRGAARVVQVIFLGFRRSWQPSSKE
jgi:hypothetical protein